MWFQYIGFTRALLWGREHNRGYNGLHNGLCKSPAHAPMASANNMCFDSVYWKFPFDLIHVAMLTVQMTALPLIQMIQIQIFIDKRHLNTIRHVSYNKT